MKCTCSKHQLHKRGCVCGGTPRSKKLNTIIPMIVAILVVWYFSNDRDVHKPNTGKDMFGVNTTPAEILKRQQEEALKAKEAQHAQANSQ